MASPHGIHLASRLPPLGFRAAACSGVSPAPTRQYCRDALFQMRRTRCTRQTKTMRRRRSALNGPNRRRRARRVVIGLQNDRGTLTRCSVRQRRRAPAVLIRRSGSVTTELARAVVEIRGQPSSIAMRARVRPTGRSQHQAHDGTGNSPPLLLGFSTRNSAFDHWRRARSRLGAFAAFAAHVVSAYDACRRLRGRRHRRCDARRRRDAYSRSHHLRNPARGKASIRRTSLDLTKAVTTVTEHRAHIPSMRALSGGT